MAKGNSVVSPKALVPPAVIQATAAALGPKAVNGWMSWLSWLWGWLPQAALKDWAVSSGKSLALILVGGGLTVGGQTLTNGDPPKEQARLPVPVQEVKVQSNPALQIRELSGRIGALENVTREVSHELGLARADRQAEQDRRVAAEEARKAAARLQARQARMQAQAPAAVK